MADCLDPVGPHGRRPLRLVCYSDLGVDPHLSASRRPSVGVCQDGSTLEVRLASAVYFAVDFWVVDAGFALDLKNVTLDLRWICAFSRHGSRQ